jgi:BirA family biotin operon repressor/biotin-[acetyl-CoA-carboxylase] ligase
VRPPEAIEWLATDAIAARLEPAASARIESLDWAVELESTNRYLLSMAPPAPGNVRVAVAEHQTAGRGRRGRSWSMPPGTGVALSVSSVVEKMPANFGAFGLAVGAAARRAVLEVTGLDVGLKWPNDLIVDDGKLGGILVELAQLADGASHVVAGIGINVQAPDDFLRAVSDFSHGARDLAGQVPAWAIDRAGLTAALIGHFVELFKRYAESGFEAYRDEWLDAHVLDGQVVKLNSASRSTVGTVRGIAADGSLIIEDSDGERHSVISGDVTIRKQDDPRD